MLWEAVGVGAAGDDGGGGGLVEPIRYRGYTIHYDPPPIPLRSSDWAFVHDDYDGAPIHSESDDCPDHRCGFGASVEDCKQQIDEQIEETGE